MYTPPHFQETRPDVLHELIRLHPLGALVTHSPDRGLDANHIPFALNPRSGAHGSLVGHVARGNPVWTGVADGDAVLVIFRAADAYISPNWYPSKHETHRQVPTWNYQVAHIHGRITVHDDARFVRGVVSRLTHEHEDQRPRPWRMADAPADYIDAMVNSIVGIEIAIDRIEGKSKLSQNKEPRDIRGAGEALLAAGQAVTGQAQIGRAMLELAPPGK